MIKNIYVSIFLTIICCVALGDTKDYIPSKAEIAQAQELAVESSKWFHYKTEKYESVHDGQCGDYALKFIVDFNTFIGKNVARLVVANNPIESGTYRVGKKVDLAKLGFNGFPSGASGFMYWYNQLYLYHPFIGAYELFLEKAWIPKTHFGVDMLDKNQIHVWASIGDISVDPTYFDLWPDRFKTPLGKDE